MGFSPQEEKKQDSGVNRGGFPSRALLKVEDWTFLTVLAFAKLYSLW